jgi:hypothetical protein
MFDAMKERKKQRNKENGINESELGTTISFV